MEKREKRARSITKTEKNILKRLLRTCFQKLSAVFFPTAAVRLKEEPRAIYPSMSRREIKAVSAAICKSAIQNAKKQL